MPIKPPNLDDRRYADILREARSLIPQYCPEWTNLNDSDPGITLVQLFAWMTEMITYRLNRVPDKTYIHFLNFIGEERRSALPAVAPVTFQPKTDGAVELPAFTRCSTRQREDNRAMPFLLTEPLTTHGCRVERLIAVRGGRNPVVREIPFSQLRDHPSALELGGGKGVQVFHMDPVEYGSDCYTPHQYLYINHDDLRLMGTDSDQDEDTPVGRLHIRRSDDGPTGMSIVDFFDWEYPSPEGWLPIASQPAPERRGGMPEQVLLTSMPGLEPLDSLRLPEDDIPLPEAVAEERWWIRGHLAFERWLAIRMLEDLEIFWKDDRGGEERPINNWDVRASGRAIHLFLQDLPPIRGGWTIRFSLVDRGIPTGRQGYLPAYRWYFRRGEDWEGIPSERVRSNGTNTVITGPLTDMASDGFNLRAERIEAVDVRRLCRDLELDLHWIRPVECVLLAGDDPRRLEELPRDDPPWSPFQIAPLIPPTIGRRLYIGSDLFGNRQQSPVLLELEVCFEMNGEPVLEPEEDYLLQLTYRAADNWRVLWSEDLRFAGFTFAQLDPDGAVKPGRRRIRLVIDPKTQLRDLFRHTVGGVESTWLRLELVKSNLSAMDKKKNRHPVVPRIYSLRLGADKTLGDDTYSQPMPGPKVTQVDYRVANRRLTRIISRATGRLSESRPFYPFMELERQHQALYLKMDRPLPAGANHSLYFRCRGESFLPTGTTVDWEILESLEHDRHAWRRIKSSASPGSSGDGLVYSINRSGRISFALPEPPAASRDGFWIRVRYGTPDGESSDTFPTIPPITHLLLNTADAVNLVTLRTERFNGYGVPHQVIQLRRHPIYLHPREHARSPFYRPELFPDIKVHVELDDGTTQEWQPAREGHLLTAGKDDCLFVVDPVEGTLTFGNGIRGRMLPVGTNNVVVDTYHVVPGTLGNVAAGSITLCEGYQDRVKPVNLLPAIGGRDAETIEEIVRRAPSLLTSRNRAVTRSDFEVIAREASGEVARAACSGEMREDSGVEVVILPRRRQGETVPDPFLSVGLRDHVQSYLKQRCLINVDPVVRLARFRPIDISVLLRLRPNANLLLAREQAIAWINRFLDPYEGGLDAGGWPFGGTLYAQDLARLVTDLPDVRHVAQVQLYDMAGSPPDESPGWEQGQGQDVLFQTDYDLFAVRRVRVLGEGSTP